MYRLCICNGRLQESKKWQERKEALDALQKLVEAPKLLPADYSELLRALRKVIAHCCLLMSVYFVAVWL